MMDLSVWTPTGLFLSRKVERIVASGLHGSFCLLPKHVDAVAGLRPGIMVCYHADSEHYLALHEGCLTKRMSHATVVTLQAYQGDSLEHLSEKIEQMLHVADEGERRTRSALAGLESRIARGLVGLESNRVRR